MNPTLQKWCMIAAQIAWNEGARRLVVAIKNPAPIPSRVPGLAAGAGLLGGGAVLATVVTRKRRAA